MRFISVILFLFIFISVVFGALAENVSAKSDISNLYNLCVNNYSEDNSALDDCIAFVDNARKVSQILNIIYVDDVDDEEYVTCLKKQINAGGLNYTTVRDNCYNSIMQTNKLKQLLSLFRVNCQYDFNSEVNVSGKYDLDVSCKSILPSICFNTDVELVKQNDDQYELSPIVKKQNDGCVDLARIQINEKKFELAKNDILLTLKPYTIVDENKNILELESLIDNKGIARSIPDMQDIEKTYYGCLTNYYLHYDYNSSHIFLENRIISDENIIDICKTKVTYAYSIYLDAISNERKTIKQQMQSKFNEFILQSDLSEMSSFLESILTMYQSYEKTQSKLSNKSGRLPLNLSLDKLIERLSLAIANKQDSEKKEKISEFKVTLLNDLKDQIEVQRKNNLPQIIEFFNKEITVLQNEEMKSIFSTLKLNIVLDFVESESVLDLSDVDFVLTPGGIKIGDLSFVPQKQIFIDGNKNYNFRLENGYIVFSQNSAYEISTDLPLTFKSNNIFIDDKNIVILTELSRKDLPGSVKNIILFKDDSGFLIYGVERVLNGYFLGLFKINENVSEKYNAETGVLFDVKKPWWDFLIVYSKSIKQGVTNAISK